MEILVTFVVFAASMLGLGLGLILSGKRLQGSCGGAAEGRLAEVVSCGVCSRQEAELCPSDEPLVRLAQLGHPNPKHHR